jgi:ABC-type amino acid transport substrate-binding protein
MMKKGLIKVISTLAAAAMCTAVLASCGDSNQLVMGTNAAFPPFEFTTTNGLVGEFDGIDVAIAKKIADSMGKELKIEDMEFDGLIASVSTGKVDMAVAGMTATEERKQNVDFSDTYYVASQVIVVGKDCTDITKAEDLKNDKTVGVVLGYTGDSIVTDDLQIPEDKITRANRGIDIVQEVKNNKLDAVVIDSATGKALAENNDLKVIEDPEVFDTEEYAIAVKKGNTELLEQINKVLAEMKESGEIEELAQKYN